MFMSLLLFMGSYRVFRSKIIIISPSFEIVSSIDLNEEGSYDVPITEDGDYYIR